MVAAFCVVDQRRSIHLEVKVLDFMVPHKIKAANVDV